MRAARIARAASTPRVGRPRLLVLHHRLPYPPHDGAAIRSYNVLRLLARDFDITALCFDRLDRVTAALDVAPRVAALGELARVERFEVAQHASRARLLWDHVRSVATGRSYLHYTFESSAFRRRVRELVAGGGFDLVHVDSMDLARYLPDVRALPVVCTHHNVESALLRRRADAARSPLRRAYLRHQARLVERDERRWLGEMALNVAVSPDDAAELARMVPEGRYAVLPNGVDTDYFAPRDGPQHGCTFVGGTTWYPNRDALGWFATEILPRLRAAGEDAPVHWVGHAEQREHARHDGVRGLTLTGFVDDVRPWLASAACVVVPLRVGGGTRLKMVEAWAMGKAVVATSVGCEGLAAVHGENILVADDADAFAAAIRRVLHDEPLRRRLGAAARRTVETTYAWEVVGRRMRELYLPLAGRKGEGLDA